MCLVTFSFDPGSRHPLVVMDNRDERYNRTAAPAAWWPAPLKHSDSSKDHPAHARSVEVSQADVAQECSGGSHSDTPPRVFAGRDLEAGGTWFAVSTAGRFAALTNFPSEPAPSDVGGGRDSAANYADQDTPAKEEGVDRHSGDSKTSVAATGDVDVPHDAATEASVHDAAPRPSAPVHRVSRGTLVRGFVEGSATAIEYAREVIQRGSEFDGFNLILWDGSGAVVYCTNRGNGSSIRELGPGVYGLANTELLRPPEWHKVVRSKAGLKSLIQSGQITTDALLALAADRHQPPDTDLPHRGRPLDLERMLAPCFIADDRYGTVASTAVIFDSELGKISFAEQTFGPRGVPLGRVDEEIPLRPLHA